MRLSGLKGFTTVNSLMQGCFLPNHLDRILVLAEPEKDVLPEPIIACPFREFDLADQDRLSGTSRRRLAAESRFPPMPGFWPVLQKLRR